MSIKSEAPMMWVPTWRKCWNSHTCIAHDPMPAHVIRTQVGREQGFMCRFVRHVCFQNHDAENVMGPGSEEFAEVSWFPSSTMAVLVVVFFIGIHLPHASTLCLGPSGLQAVFCILDMDLLPRHFMLGCLGSAWLSQGMDIKRAPHPI